MVKIFKRIITDVRKNNTRKFLEVKRLQLCAYIKSIVILYRDKKSESDL